MVADVVVQEGNDAPVAWTTIANARFCTKDLYDPLDTYPCVIPAISSGLTYYSYWKHIRLYFSGSFTKINNVRVYTDGPSGWTLGTGGQVVIGQRDAGDHGCPTGNYEQSAGVEGTSGYAIKDGANGHNYYLGESAGCADLFSFTSGSTCIVDTADHTVAEGSDSIVIQAEILEDATQGTMDSQTITFLYDEI